MFRQSVHHNGESQQVTPGSENEEQQLRKLQEITTNRTKQDVASVCHAMDERVSLSELANHITGIRRKKS